MKKALLVLLFASLCCPLFSQVSIDSAVRSALDEGKKAEDRREYGTALDIDRKALKLAKGKCADCFAALANLQLKTASLP